MVRRFPTIIAAAMIGAVTACGPNPAAGFCDSYGKAVGQLYAAADNYAAAPAEFAVTVDTAMDDLSRLRAGAPNEDLRRAFDSAYFSLTVFSEDAALADFLARADFSQDDVVLACADNGIELKPAEG